MHCGCIARNLENIRIQTAQNVGPNFGNAAFEKGQMSTGMLTNRIFWIVIENEIYCCVEPNFRHVNLIMKTVLRIGSHWINQQKKKQKKSEGWHRDFFICHLQILLCSRIKEIFRTDFITFSLSLCLWVCGAYCSTHRIMLHIFKPTTKSCSINSSQ